MKHSFYKKAVYTALCISFSLTASAQMNLENRIEFELKNGFSNEKIYKSPNKFFVIESRADKKEQNKLEIKYDLYDGNLKAIKSASVFITAGMYEAVHYNDDSCVYKLYRNIKREFLLSKVRIDDLKTTVQEGNLPKGIYLKDMKVVGTKAWFESTIKKKTCLLQIDLITGKTQISDFVENQWSKKSNIVNYQLDKNSGELLMFVNKYIKKGVCELSQVRVNETCELCDNVQLTGTGDKVITSVSGCKIADSTMVYTGTYSGKFRNISEGMFFAQAANKKLNYINYINFLDMENFLSYMPEKKQDKIQKKKNKAENAGKEFSITYNIAAHDIIPVHGGYILIGEAYYPTYTSVAHTTTSFANGMAMTQTYYTTVFNGYEYTHAFIARFSDKGELLWDQCFEMNPFERPMYVKRFIKISEQTENDIAMIFASGNYVFSKVFDYDGKIISDKKVEIIATGKDTEKTNWTTSNADYWFDNNFLIYGSQRVKDTEDKSRRRVFFVNKISF